MKLKAAPPAGDSEEVRKEWLDRLDRLLTNVEQWTAGTDWVTRRIDKVMEERGIGEYVAQALLMQNGVVRLLLEPIALYTANSEIGGVVDLYRMPAYDDILKLFQMGEVWYISYADFASFDIGDDPIRLTKRTFLTALGKLLGNGK